MRRRLRLAQKKAVDVQDKVVKDTTEKVRETNLKSFFFHMVGATFAAASVAVYSNYSLRNGIAFVLGSVGAAAWLFLKNPKRPELERTEDPVLREYNESQARDDIGNGIDMVTERIIAPQVTKTLKEITGQFTKPKGYDELFDQDDEKDKNGSGN